MTFRAIVARQHGGRVIATVETVEDDVLTAGDVTVSVEWSNVNYKDAIALAGQKIIQTFPLIPGIDFAGTVESTDDPRFKAGDKVVATGWDLSQTHHGGFAQKARVPADWLVKLAPSISTRDAMAIGTAGFTAMLSVLALEHGGISPEKGELLVTGASGGVGSIAIALLSKLGYRVAASTGKAEEERYLRDLGATTVIDRNTLSAEGPPISSERWAGAIDAVGGHSLANILAQTAYGGVVTTCGFVGGRDLPASVLPFILRGVTLAGIDSVRAPLCVRERAWQRLATDLDLEKLSSTISVVGLADVGTVARDMLSGKVRGRTLVDVGS
ncbi:quinone oxidoreductase YhdH/YhfP family protein (plasmid) [Rhizobium sp. NXC14]|uniref:MDR family oxidoreductase n=1 Tax=Rhizobium sp. NXC14 TaxID=1981173 RepID=UPI000A20AE92|nr:MDR family oxidoreductase [Rhizobium sp. NXC14]ARO34349.1 quinone oxidoreductase YhdH/YhfP family protein [Rhizobium sp. NXC14]